MPLIQQWSQLQGFFHPLHRLVPHSLSRSGSKWDVSATEAAARAAALIRARLAEQGYNPNKPTVTAAGSSFVTEIDINDNVNRTVLTRKPVQEEVS